MYFKRLKKKEKRNTTITKKDKEEMFVNNHYNDIVVSPLPLSMVINILEGLYEMSILHAI